MSSTKKATTHLNEEHREEAAIIIDSITCCDDVDMYRQMLLKLLLGWITTPLELEPEERLSMVIMYEDLQNHLLEVRKLQHKIDVESVKSAS